MDKHYQHRAYEQKIYDLWESQHAFNPDTSTQPAQRAKKSTQKDPRPFTILMPPPNANDPLHIGHAMFVTVDDILIRYHRMLGDDTLWLPGTDHAGIETQFVFEKKLKKKGQSRFDFNRDDLYQQIWDYVQENSDVAVNQLKKLGASADWSRFKFMLDEEMVKIVIDTFSQLAKDDLLYRDVRLVNYCTHCGTGFSELEVKHVEKKAKLYYMQYGPFTLATTRPETKFGDTAVAVHPDDKRYQQYIGQTITVQGGPITSENPDGSFKLKVIADKYVDPEFGTGVVKITPAHDFNDFEVWQRHQDEIPGIKQCIDYRGHMTSLAGKYAGMYLKKARREIVNDLEKKGLMVKIDDNYVHKVGTCYRCGTVIEPLPLPQFFVKVKPLTKKVLKILDEGQTSIHGAGHDKILRHWLKNLKDWNISRQIVWGIRMPVWYDTSNPDINVVFIDSAGKRVEGTLQTVTKIYKGNYSLSEITAGLQELRAPIGTNYVISTTSPGENYLQETDTFDTWFSSSQWPFTTLMTSKEANSSKNDAVATHKSDFNRFYPTSVMGTAYDILMFWVMRMMMMSIYKTGKTPFADVYLHGLIRDAQGKKMSKSKGNTVNPLEVIDQYGADSLRLALIIRSNAGLDKSVGSGDFKAARNFINKLWNATRFILMSYKNATDKTASDGAVTHLQNASEKSILLDQEFLKKINTVVNTVTRQLNAFKIGLAAETLHNEFWHWFCDESIENAKGGVISQQVLTQGLITFVKLLHPFIPFVTEAIWEQLKTKKIIDQNEPLLIMTEWPQQPQ